MSTRLATLLAALAATTLPPAAVAQETTPSYGTLMRLPFATRSEQLQRMPEAERDAFLARLPRDRRAVLLVDPEDCGLMARHQRLGLAHTDTSSAGENTVKDVGQSLTNGALDRMVPGVSRALSIGAKANEINQMRQYVDVCDMPPEQRAQLLEPVDEPPPKKDDSLFDKASKFFAR